MTNRRLAAGEVHVWSWRNLPDRVGDWLRAGLDAAELRRAADFVFARDRARYIGAHAGMRSVLGSLLGVKPAAVMIALNETGKPCLAGPFSSHLHFNLSHSHDMAALAVAADHPVGLDIERIRPMAFDTIETFFTPGEQAALARLPPEYRLTGLYNAWTRKEAYTKAIGLGLDTPLDSFEVSLAPDEPAALLSVAADPAEAAHWQIVHFIPATDYVGAVAMRARDWKLVPRSLGVPAG